MQLFGHDCGCDSRKEIMFGDGGLNRYESVVMVAVLAIGVYAFVKGVNK